MDYNSYNDKWLEPLFGGEELELYKVTEEELYETQLFMKYWQ